MYAFHSRSCGTSGLSYPTNGVDVEITEAIPGTTETPTTGRTVVPWLPGDDPGLLDIDGLPVFKRSSGIVAIDMDTGQKLWDIPVGETPANIRNHPRLAGVEVPPTGAGGRGILMVMGDLLLQTGGEGGGSGAVPRLNARDKQTGEILASVDLPANGQYGMMSFMHEGKQYIVVNSTGGPSEMPGGYVALTLP
jgi:quinoprotein glucose dehydrogenase